MQEKSLQKWCRRGRRDRELLCLGYCVSDIRFLDKFQRNDDRVYSRQVIPHTPLCGCPIVEFNFLRRKPSIVGFQYLVE